MKRQMMPAQAGWAKRLGLISVRSCPQAYRLQTGESSAHGTSRGAEFAGRRLVDDLTARRLGDPGPVLAPQCRVAEQPPWCGRERQSGTRACRNDQEISS